MKEITLKVSDLKRPEKNVRNHSDAQIAEYVRSLEMFGQIRPAVIDENNVVLAGNGMLDAMLQMGMEECKCYQMTGLTETQKKKLMLADNKVFEMGKTNMFAIEEIIQELGNDLDVPGYDSELLKMITATATEATREIINDGVLETNWVEKRSENVVSENRGGVLFEAVPEEERTVIFDESPQKTEVASGRFIVCPKCGEKIWL